MKSQFEFLLFILMYRKTKNSIKRKALKISSSLSIFVESFLNHDYTEEDEYDEIKTL